MLIWHHRGFNVYCGPAIWPHDENALENLARYIVRAAFSQERMAYIATDQSPDSIAKAIYHSKDGKTSKTFHTLDWLPQLTMHITNKREQMVRDGVYPPWRSYYSNKFRGLRKKNDKDDNTPAVIHSDLSRKIF